MLMRARAQLRLLKEAVDRGLDAAIVNYSKIYPLYKIPEKEVELRRKLIFQDRSDGDPLQVYMAYFASLGKGFRQGRGNRGRESHHRREAQADDYSRRADDRVGRAKTDLK